MDGFGGWFVTWLVVGGLVGWGGVGGWAGDCGTYNWMRDSGMRACSLCSGMVAQSLCVRTVYKVTNNICHRSLIGVGVRCVGGMFTVGS